MAIPLSRLDDPDAYVREQVEKAIRDTGLDPAKFMRPRADVEGARNPKPSPYPFCVDCKHCRTAEELRAELPSGGFIPCEGSGPWCVNLIDVVTGRVGYETCKVSRRFLRGASGNINPVCGLEGRLFEAKDTE